MTHASSIALLTLGLVLSASSADAELTTDKCLAQKLNAWSVLRKCEATEAAKELLGKPNDVAKCQTKFQEKLAKISDKATNSAIGCRYRDHGDGTVTDYDTGLEWEQKVSPGGGASDPHDSANIYVWTDSGCTFTGCPNGSAFAAFLGLLNHHTAGGMINFACFRFRCDWRLPTLSELQSILDLGPGCGVSSQCIDPIFGPTGTVFYWSSTSLTGDALFAWGVDFDDGSVGSPGKLSLGAVRAVRNAL